MTTKKNENPAQLIFDTIIGISKLSTMRVFLYPVDEVRDMAPDYYKVVTNPMDVSTIITKLKDHKYDKLQQIQEDFELIVKNCRMYNLDPIKCKVILKLCSQFEEAFKGRFEKLHSQLIKLGFNPETNTIDYTNVNFDEQSQKKISKEQKQLLGDNANLLTQMQNANKLRHSSNSRVLTERSETNTSMSRKDSMDISEENNIDTNSNPSKSHHHHHHHHHHNHHHQPQQPNTLSQSYPNIINTLNDNNSTKICFKLPPLTLNPINNSNNTGISSTVTTTTNTTGAYANANANAVNNNNYNTSNSDHSMNSTKLIISKSLPSQASGNAQHQGPIVAISGSNSGSGSGLGGTGSGLSGTSGGLNGTSTGLGGVAIGLSANSGAGGNNTEKIRLTIEPIMKANLEVNEAVHGHLGGANANTNASTGTGAGAGNNGSMNIPMVSSSLKVIEHGKQMMNNGKSDSLKIQIKKPENIIKVPKPLTISIPQEPKIQKSPLDLTKERYPTPSHENPKSLHTLPIEPPQTKKSTHPEELTHTLGTIPLATTATTTMTTPTTNALISNPQGPNHSSYPLFKQDDIDLDPPIKRKNPIAGMSGGSGGVGGTSGGAGSSASGGVGSGASGGAGGISNGAGGMSGGTSEPPAIHYNSIIKFNIKEAIQAEAESKRKMKLKHTKKLLKYQDKFCHKFRHITDERLIDRLDHIKQHCMFDRSSQFNNAFICYYNFLTYISMQLKKPTSIFDKQAAKLFYKLIKRILKAFAKLLKLSKIEFTTEEKALFERETTTYLEVLQAKEYKANMPMALPPPPSGNVVKLNRVFSTPEVLPSPTLIKIPSSQISIPSSSITPKPIIPTTIPIPTIPGLQIINTSANDTVNKLSTKIAIRPTHTQIPTKTTPPLKASKVEMTKEEGEKLKIKKAIEALLMKIKNNFELPSFKEILEKRIQNTWKNPEQIKDPTDDQVPHKKKKDSSKLNTSNNLLPTSTQSTLPESMIIEQDTFLPPSHDKTKPIISFTLSNTSTRPSLLLKRPALSIFQQERMDEEQQQQQQQQKSKSLPRHTKQSQSQQQSLNKDTRSGKVPPFGSQGQIKEKSFTQQQQQKPVNEDKTNKISQEVKVWSDVPSLQMQYSKVVNIDTTKIGFRVNELTRVDPYELNIYFFGDKSFTEANDRIIRHWKNLSGNRVSYKPYHIKGQMCYIFKKPWEIDSIMAFKLLFVNKLQNLNTTTQRNHQIKLTINNKLSYEAIEQMNYLENCKLRHDEELKEFHEILESNKIKQMDTAVKHIETLIANFKIENRQHRPDIGLYYSLDDKLIRGDNETLIVKIITPLSDISDFSIWFKNQKIIGPP